MRDALLVELGDAPAGAVTLADYGERVLERWTGERAPRDRSMMEIGRQRS